MSNSTIVFVKTNPLDDIYFLSGLPVFKKIIYYIKRFGNEGGGSTNTQNILIIMYYNFDFCFKKTTLLKFSIHEH